MVARLVRSPSGAEYAALGLGAAPEHRVLVPEPDAALLKVAAEWDGALYGTRLPRLLEERFLAEARAHRRPDFVFWLLAFFTFTQLTFGLDLLLIPHFWREDLVIRLGGIALPTLWAVLCLRRATPRHGDEALGVAALVVNVLGVLLILTLADQPSLPRMMTLLGGLTCVSCLAPLAFSQLCAANLAVLAGALAMLVLGGAPMTEAEEAVLPMAVLLALLLLAGGWRRERTARQAFMLGLRLRFRAQELARSNETLHTLSQTDPLTGVANRRHFEAESLQAWNIAARQGRPIGLLMIDIDHFKEFNDHYGHLEGDQCLRAVAGALSGQLRAGSLVARYGGEEFIVLLPDTTAGEALRVAERLRTAVAALAVGPGAVMRVSVSIGAAATLPVVVPGLPDATVQQGLARLIAVADQALYRAKNHGRNRSMLGQDEASECYEDIPPSA